MTARTRSEGLTPVSSVLAPPPVRVPPSEKSIHIPRALVPVLTVATLALAACSTAQTPQTPEAQPPVAAATATLTAAPVEVATAASYDALSPAEIERLQNEPISIDEIRLMQQNIPYVDENGVTHMNSGSFMEFIKIDTNDGPGIIVPKDPHIRARLEWLAIHQPTNDKTGNWQNPGDFKGESTAGDPREYWKVLELWGPGSTTEGEWKTMLSPGQSVEAGTGTRLAGSEWGYPAVLDANFQPTSEGWTAPDVLADVLFSIARRANFTVISPQVQGWVNGQQTTGFLTVQDAVQANWLHPRVQMTPAPKATQKP